MTIPERFRQARERKGFLVSDMAMWSGVSEDSVLDLEGYENEWAIYPASSVQRFAEVLGIRPAELLDVVPCGEPLSHPELARLIREYCRAQRWTLAEFGYRMGLDCTCAVENPLLFLTHVRLGLVKDICEKIGADWQRFVIAL